MRMMQRKCFSIYIVDRLCIKLILVGFNGLNHDGLLKLYLGNPRDHVRNPRDHVRNPTDHVRNPSVHVRNPTEHVRNWTDHVGNPTDCVRNHTDHVISSPASPDYCKFRNFRKGFIFLELRRHEN